MPKKEETPADRAGVPRDNPWYDYLNRESAKGLQAFHWALSRYHGGAKTPPRPKVAESTAKSVGGKRSWLSRAADFVGSVPDRLGMQPHNRPRRNTPAIDRAWEQFGKADSTRTDRTNPGNVQARRGGLRAR